MSLGEILVEAFEKIAECLTLASSAHIWSSLPWKGLMKAPCPPGELIEAPEFNKEHKEFVITHSFLEFFQAWEWFLEETFVRYLLGQPSPSGFAPTRLVVPKSELAARKLLVDAGYKHASWTSPRVVSNRASRLFLDGEPYKSHLSSMETRLFELRTLRNAIAHSTEDVKDEFRDLVIRHMNRYPVGMGVGEFLDMTVPGSSPPKSFFEEYVIVLRYLTEQLVPT